MGGVALDDGPSGVKAPDGGWGWAVLFGCFVITGFSYAFPKAVSVFFKELIREFDVGYSDTAWISSILLAMLYGTGPICSVLVNRFGCRPVMMVGGLFASLGMILASFSTSIIHIYLSTGVITGLGLALNFQPSLIMLNRYFSEKRPLANGLAAAGSPVACAASPHWDRCCSMLEEPEGQAKVIEEKKKPKAKLLDFSVFKDRGFLIYTIAASIMVLGLFVPPVFVVSYAKELGNEDTKSALLLTILGFIDIFARPTCGIIAGLKWVRPRCVYFFSIAMLFNGIADIVGSFSKDYNSLVVFCIFFGISYGMVGALQFEVLMAIVGTEKFPSAIGLVLLMEAIAVLVGPPSAGRLLDATKVYMYVFLLAGCEVCLSSIVLATGNFFCLKKKPQEPAMGEMELLNKPPEENSKAIEGTEKGKEEQEEPDKEREKEPEEKGPEEKQPEEKQPESAKVDSAEVETFLKDGKEENGDVVANPETCL
ncbi:hypothetical protein ANANG_G00036320 [Anguilla anguilla]|uniref:Major facilitator superfamily (MFS) profile domain-containing protein n=1 Tax=Anguilla anguilla TaxID=7936 RepID=A0A9D3MUF9_ANGAN|nr:hypothetical protein ANANG_G00036320 [Anguilla anguilla]